MPSQRTIDTYALARVRFGAPASERSSIIGRTRTSPFAATGVLSLGLLLPFGAGTFSDRAVSFVRAAAAATPIKHVTFIRSGTPEEIETRAATVDDLLIERGIARSPDDGLSADPTTPITDGSVIEYRPAVPVTLVVDNVTRSMRTPAENVREFLAAQDIAYGPHDRISPLPTDSLESETVIRVTHVTSWITRVRQAIAPPIKKLYDFALAPGKTRIIDPGVPGTKEITLAYSQPNRALTPTHRFLAARILRKPRMRVIAEGIGEYASFSHLAKRGIDTTYKLATSALTMIATAYTANCVGCSGITAIGRVAGHGIVAVDPRVIPLGTHLFIPGYGHALAGDTGGAIRGNRIDLGFNSYGAAMSFGRRPITVYVLK